MTKSLHEIQVFKSFLGQSQNLNQPVNAYYAAAVGALPKERDRARDGLVAALKKLMIRHTKSMRLNGLVQRWSRRLLDARHAIT